MRDGKSTEKEGPRLGIQGPKGRVPVIRPRRDRIMGSSIQLPSQRQVGTTHTTGDLYKQGSCIESINGQHRQQAELFADVGFHCETP